MNLQTYLAKRKALAPAPESRGFCFKCKQPLITCFCAEIHAFDPLIKFVILIHPMEVRRRIATGRMAHLSLSSSLLIDGEDFSDDARVTALIDDEANACCILYPGANSTDIGQLSLSARAEFFPSGRTPVIFVIDGTWRTARKMLRLSASLSRLPRICFSPSRPSGFLSVRKQPSPECFSTIEAVHEAISLLGESRGFDVSSREHDHLLRVFDSMVRRQIDFAIKPPADLREPTTY